MRRRVTNIRPDPSPRLPRCRLKGAIRRLDVPDVLEFDEAEYADAADSVFQAAAAIADECRRA